MAACPAHVARVPRGGDAVSDPTRVLFVNSGILGMQSFSKYIRETMALDPEIEARHIDLSEDLRLDERIIRRALCMRWWSDGLFGVKNLDFARLPHESPARCRDLGRSARAHVVRSSSPDLYRDNLRDIIFSMTGRQARATTRKHA